MTPMNIRVWELLRVLTNDACRPFSLMRNGMVLGEGAAVLVLEFDQTTRTRRSDAAGRNCWLWHVQRRLRHCQVGPGGSNDRYGAGDCRVELTAGADLLRHATGLGLLPTTSQKLKRCGAYSVGGFPNIAISSTKPIHGHTLGAAGAIELVITIMAMRTNTAPPTINWLGPDPNRTESGAERSARTADPCGDVQFVRVRRY